MLATERTVLSLAEGIGRRLVPSPTLALNELVNRLWVEGKTVYHLGFGESRFPVHPKVQEALRAHSDQKSYLPTQGIAELRSAAAAFYSRHLGLSFTPSQVIIGPGSKSLIFATQMALAGDLILPAPSWVSYGPQAQLLGKSVHVIPAAAEDGYRLHLEALDGVIRRMGPGQKILVLNSPSNPTSRMFDAGEVEALAAYCREHGIMILSDEIYALTAHGHQHHFSPAQFYPEGTLTCSGLSKHLSLGGWRLGLALAPPGAAGERLMSALRVIAGEIWSSSSGPVQYAAAAAYSGDPEIEQYIADCAALHGIRTQYLYAGLVAAGVPCPRPDGGFYVFPNFNRWRVPLQRRGVTTSTELAGYLLRELHIASLPGSAFWLPEEDLALRLASSYLDLPDDAAAEAMLTAYRSGAGAAVLLRDYHPEAQAALARLVDFVKDLEAELD